MKRYKKIVFFTIALISMTDVMAQYTINGSVSTNGKPITEVNIDIYEYTAALTSFSTDSKGQFSISLQKDKVYLLLFYKSGYVIKSFMVHAISKNAIDNLNVQLENDLASPDGLYFHSPTILINATEQTKSAFDLTKITPQQKADSSLVLINRAQTNQYLLVSKLKLNGNTLLNKNTIKSKLQLIQQELATAETNEKSFLIKEEKAIEKSKQTTGDKQVDWITEAQLGLANRLGEMVKSLLLQQEEMLLEASLNTADCENILSKIKNSTDTLVIDGLKKMYADCNFRTFTLKRDAVRLSKKFNKLNNEFALNYQEYIELLRYKNKLKDKKIDTLAAAVKLAETKIEQQIPANNLLTKIEQSNEEIDNQTLENAMAEEARFANYEEDSAVVAWDATFNRVNRKKIGIDTYDVLVNKKLQFRYLKNEKPITKITYEFETKRKYKDVILLIHQINKFSK